jgi:hypothetical protein
VCRDLAGEVDYCGPDNFRHESDRLWRNLGPEADGRVRFEDVTETMGLTGGFGPALGVVAADFDGDGWLDLYVANDGAPNNLWHNLEGRGFEDRALMAGTAVNARGRAEASMGVDAADYDGDGDLDLFMTHLVSETNTLYRNDGTGHFDDVTDAAGLGAPSRLHTAFGTAWIDFENDGWLDLVVANGAVKKIEALVRAGDGFPLHEPNQLFRNTGGRFEEISELGGSGFERSEVSRGVLAGDLDDDGDVDAVVINNNGPARVLLNRTGSERRWLGLRLTVGEPARDAPGAQAAVVRADGAEIWRRVRLDGSFLATQDPRLVFGLGDDPVIAEVRVRWADGKVETWRDLAIDRYHTLHRGTGSPAS